MDLLSDLRSPMGPLLNINRTQKIITYKLLSFFFNLTVHKIDISTKIGTTTIFTLLVRRYRVQVPAVEISFHHTKNTPGYTQPLKMATRELWEGRDTHHITLSCVHGLGNMTQCVLHWNWDFTVYSYVYFAKTWRITMRSLCVGKDVRCFAREKNAKVTVLDAFF